MEISRSAVGVLAGLCVAAGAGAAYLVTRATPAPQPVVSLATEGAMSEPASLVEAKPKLDVREAPEAPEVRAAPRRTASPPRAARIVEKSQPPRATRAPARLDDVGSNAAEALDPTASVVEEPVVESQPTPDQVPAPGTGPAEAAERPEPESTELVVSADSVVGLRMQTTLTSERARIEDEVVAQVSRDVRVGDRIAIPAGARAQGTVTLVEQGGRIRGRARLGIRFTSIVLADGTRLAIDTDAIYREGEAPGNESAAKIGGGAIGGAIIGGILGGAKGAILGGTAGASAGTAVTLAGGRNAATLPAGAAVTVRLREPVSVIVEK